MKRSQSVVKAVQLVKLQNNDSLFFLTLDDFVIF